MGAFLTSVWLDFSRAFLPEMKKDRLGAIPNRSYHHIQRANCNFSSGIVAFARYFQLFLSVNIKRITQTLYQYLRDWMANPVDCDTRDGCTPFGNLRCICAPTSMKSYHLLKKQFPQIFNQRQNIIDNRCEDNRRQKISNLNFCNAHQICSDHNDQ